ncbi:BglG family transcription antiterminator [Clostridium beijerinckii]|uniref:BglG family transcription antiterminator n=1 Tax=Clostridium beijerinckii TaxID=1520 RepID=A0AAW3W4L1_CLOBE|nr:BglG family transcription antiterminator [Clostridium beijerinckii]MBC2456094.1 BglG family transcription antiterminator [Clostridium beijerinckii]MBC2473641.1 BglG family transcription antiterminator [Clostridium beijerinckii]NOV62982.1 lichenan operon transcriptional antiterminator [Clostridium beijerinckii]NOV70056.1 lichenan operon transcriptional antiterminator [Clostridium beijerinckii]NOW31037.1 lichenan operon transcriptional antiterminator [Clostridium beijerinckii]
MINKKELKIISFLLDKNHHITGDEISNFIGVSSKTLRSYIRNINQELRKIDSNIACVKGRGYILEINNRKSFDNELLELYEEDISSKSFIPTTHDGRVVFIIKRLLLLELKYNKGITHNELCDLLFIGLTTLKTDLVVVKRKLRKFQIELLKDGVRGVTLKGNEEDIRSCISYYIFNRFENDIINLNSIEMIFEKSSIEEMECILIAAINKNNISITDISFYNLLIHILIAIKRVKNENTLAKPLFADELQEIYEYKVAKEIANRIFKETKIELPEEEIYYITQHLCTRKIINDNGESKLDLNDQYIKMVIEILNHVEEVIGIDFRKDKSLIWSLAIHLKASITRIKYDMHIANDMLSEIKKNYPFAYKISSIIAQYIESIIEKTVNDDEIGFICLHFAAALERMKNGKGEIKLRTLIVCASGLGTSMIISAKIKREFSNDIDIVKIIPLNELSQVDKKSYDIILSTIKINIEEYKLEDKKIMYISPIFKSSDLSLLKEFIQENTEDHLLKFLEFTEEELFFPEKNLKSKEDILNFMLNEMVKKSFIGEEDKEYFYKRENISSTEIGNFIAIPHAIDISPKISKVCILINKKPVKWEEENVRLVILMSIEKELYIEFESIFENLYSVLSDEERVSKLMNVRNYKDFIKLLR